MTPGGMLTPAYRLTVAGQVVDTTSAPRASTVVSISTAADLDTPSASAVVVLGHAAGLLPVVGDSVTLELGYPGTDGMVRVVTGSAVRVETGLRSVRIQVQDSGAALLRAFGDRTYEAMTAGAVVRDLAQQAAVALGTVQDGVSFPAYVVDGRRPVARHLRDLAGLCGFDVYLDPADRLHFRRWSGGAAAHIYEYAKHVLELTLARARPSAGAVRAWGESPGPGRGADAWAWLTKDFSGSVGSAGSGAPAMVIERAVLRTASAAQAAAQAAATDAVRATLTGQVVGLGRAAVRLGDAVILRGLPGAAGDGTYQVRGVAHRVSKRHGFTTTVAIRGQQTV